MARQVGGQGDTSCVDLGTRLIQSVLERREEKARKTPDQLTPDALVSQGRTLHRLLVPSLPLLLPLPAPPG